MTPLRIEFFKSLYIIRILKDFIYPPNTPFQIISENKGTSEIPSGENLEIIFKIADAYFAENNFDNCFEILLEHYPQNKEEVK